DWDEDAFVSFHGSWNREPPTGYGIVRIPWSGNAPNSGRDSKDGYSFILQAPDLSACPDGCFRPVGLTFDPKGRLFGSSDSTGEIFIIQHSNGNESNNGASRLLPMTLLWTLAIISLAYFA
ncbi:hypothetical protein FRB91_010485, partial [Serendipita sp. 411]